MNSAECNYLACKRETLAVIFAVKKFRVYLLSETLYKLVTDHQALLKKNDVHGRLARGLNFLAKYEFEVEYYPWTGNGAVEYLSRMVLADRQPSVDADEVDLVTTVG